MSYLVIILNVLAVVMNWNSAMKGDKLSMFFVIMCSLFVVYNLVAIYGGAQ